MLQHRQPERPGSEPGVNNAHHVAAHTLHALQHASSSIQKLWPVITPCLTGVSFVPLHRHEKHLWMAVYKKNPVRVQSCLQSRRCCRQKKPPYQGGMHLAEPFEFA